MNLILLTVMSLYVSVRSNVWMTIKEHCESVACEGSIFFLVNSAPVGRPYLDGDSCSFSCHCSGLKKDSSCDKDCVIRPSFYGTPDLNFSVGGLSCGEDSIVNL